jgi:ABC-type multidrug transport system ATPase subunit
MTESTPAIEDAGLAKRYGSPQMGLLAVDHISFQVRQGEVFGFLGSNGAGKTTPIRMLASWRRKRTRSQGGARSGSVPNGFVHDTADVCQASAPLGFRLAH